MNKIPAPGLCIIMIACLLFLTACATEEDYTIDGDRVYVDDDNVYISVEPHTISNSGWVYAEFESKVYSGDVDIAFGFNTESIRPKYIQYYNPHEEDIEKSYTCEHEFNYTTDPNFFTCYNEENSTLIFEHSFLTGNIPAQTAYWNDTINVEWVDFSSSWESANVDFDGKNKWWFKQGQHINSGQTYNIRYYLEKTSTSYGKYDVAIKPSSETIQEAITNEHLYFLDPWFIGSTDYDDGILGYWNMDYYTVEGGRNYMHDSTTNELDLQEWELNGVPIVDGSGFLGKAAFFDYNSNGQWLNATVQAGTMTEMTYCAWVNATSDHEDTGKIFVTSGPKIDITINHPSSGEAGEFNFALTTTAGSASVHADDTGNLKLKGYTFVCGVWDGATMYSYVNGTVDSVTAALGGTLEITEGNLAMGCDVINIPGTGGDDHEFGGQLDEVGWWNRSLTGPEIVVLYDNYIAGYGYEGLTNNVSGVFIKNMYYNSTISTTPELPYFNDTINCSFLGAIGTTFNATINWTNGTNFIERTNFTDQPNGTIISDLLNIDGLGYLPDDSILCSANILNLTDTETITLSGVISNYAPSVPTSLTPQNGSVYINNYNLSFNCTGSIDPEGYDINYTFYNGTTYPPTDIGQNSLETQFFYNVTAATTSYVSCKACTGGYCSYTLNTTVFPTDFGTCDVVGGTPIIEFTFQDEINSSSINGTANVDVDLYSTANGLTSDTVNYIYTNTSGNESYGFCVNPVNTPIVADFTFYYSGVGYVTRLFQETYTLTSTLTDQILYLLSSDIGSYSTYFVQDSVGVSIKDVGVTVERQIGGSWVEVSSGITDGAGSIQFWLNPDFIHRFSFVKVGYTSLTENIQPTQASYVIQLDRSTSDIEYTSETEGMTWTIKPIDNYLNPGTTYTFDFNISSTLENIYGCRMELMNSSTVLDTTTGCNVGFNGSSISTNYAMINGTLYGRFAIMNSTGDWRLLSEDIRWLGLDVPSNYTVGTSYAFSQLTNWTGFGQHSEQVFSRVFFFYLMLIILLGILTYTTGFDLRSPLSGMTLVGLIIILASAGGFFNFDLIPGEHNAWRSFFSTWAVGLTAAFLGIGAALQGFRRSTS